MAQTNVSTSLPIPPQVRSPLVITSGEPAGIGPDLCVMLASSSIDWPCVVIGDQDCLKERARQRGLPLRIRPYTPGLDHSPDHGALVVWHQPLATPAKAGQLNPENAPSVLAMLDHALAGIQNGDFSALMTMPVHKGVINDAGFAFSGHTEYLAAQTNTPRVVMMLAGETDHGPLRVALATTHIPLSLVPDALQRESLRETLSILHQSLRTQWGIVQPRILVTGLNPHAGEGGHLGREEIEVITPVLAEMKAHGCHIAGPLPADTAFTPPHLSQADAILAMYHDQGLAVLKYATFGRGYNVTLGLPIIRTSVDHGTALDRAGTGHIHTGSLHAALNAATRMIQAPSTGPTS